MDNDRLQETPDDARDQRGACRASRWDISLHTERRDAIQPGVLENHAETCADIRRCARSPKRRGYPLHRLRQEWDRRLTARRADVEVDGDELPA